VLTLTSSPGAYQIVCNSTTSHSAVRNSSWSLHVSERPRCGSGSMTSGQCQSIVRGLAVMIDVNLTLPQHVTLFILQTADTARFLYHLRRLRSIPRRFDVLGKTFKTFNPIRNRHTCNIKKLYLYIYDICVMTYISRRIPILNFLTMLNDPDKLNKCVFFHSNSQISMYVTRDS